VSDSPQRETFAKPAGAITNGRAKIGFLVLTQSSLVHVPSRVAYFGMPFGALGVLLAQAIGKQAAVRSAANPSVKAIVVPLDQITATGPTKFRMARNILQVTRTDGTTIVFGTKYKTWQPYLARSLANTGAQVAPLETS
jgi:hypothetical protein